MDLYYKQELAVGGLVIAALMILVGGLLWLTGQSMLGGGRVTVPVAFTSVSGLTDGDPVQISGVIVGRVAAVDLQDEGRVIVWMEIEEHVRPRIDATAEVRSLDFLGAKYLAYSPGRAQDFLPDDEVILGVDETELASSAVQLTEEATRTLIQAQEVISAEMAAQVHRALQATEQAMAVVARVGSGPMVANANDALASVRNAAQALDTTLSNPSINESLDQLDEIAVGVREMTDGLAAVTQNLALMLELMRSPDGSIGRALSDTTLYQDMHEVLQSLRLLLDDIRERPGRYVNISVF
jgi:phospholipid/cholesterol/gamma-HCH transport system substrate-binding protein